MFAPTRIVEKTIRGIPNLGALIRRTLKLRRDLERLVKRFPEADLAPEKRIFWQRLLSTRWQHLPEDLRKGEALKWIEQYGQYVEDLEGYISYVLLKPDVFNALPFNGKSELSAEQCIRRLELQEEALRRLDTDDSTDDVVGKLRAEVKRHGVKYVAHAIGIDRTTVSGMAMEETNRRRGHWKEWRNTSGRSIRGVV